MTQSLDEEQLLALVRRYAATISLADKIIPQAVLTMIHHYIPKSYWLQSGYAIAISDSRDKIWSIQRGWSTAYSTAHAILSQQHRYIWKIEILACGKADEIRLGIASSTSALDDEFAYNEDGHNYSYIAYGSKGCVGYNGTFEPTAYRAYGGGDVVSIELNQNDQTVAYYTNGAFVYQQRDLHKANYRAAASLFGAVSIRMVSFERIFIND